MIKTLFDSYGRVKELPVVDHKLKTFVLNSDEGKTMIAELKEEAGKVGDLSDYKFKAKQNRLYLYGEETFDDVLGKKDNVVGIAFTFNQADGDICKMQYFITPKEDWDKGKLSYTQDALLFEKQNVQEERVFPALQGIIEHLREYYAIIYKDDKSSEKNSYILTTDRYTKNPRGMVWNLYNTLKKTCELCSVDANGNIFYERNEQKCMVQIKDGILFSNGNMYRTPEAFLEADASGKNRVNVKRFGDDKQFAEYLSTGTISMESQKQADKDESR